MISPTFQFNADELASALGGIKPLDLLERELSDPAEPPELAGRLTPWLGPTAGTGPAPTDLLLLEDLHLGVGYLLPGSTLRECRTAALVGLVARQLVPPGGVTAAIVGPARTGQALLMTVAHHMPGVRRVVLCPAEGTATVVGQWVLDEIDLAGIGLSVVGIVGKAVLGAKLVVVTGEPAGQLEIGQLDRGAVVVNATGRDLPDDLVGAVEEVYVDTPALVGRGPDQNFRRIRPRIDADLGAVCRGTHSGRANPDHVLLVELLSANTLDIPLGCLLSRAAVDRNLGIRLGGW
ncbi:MAG TPA: hypothetical protein VFV67_22405 [Actinophytocola sp.]|uniref:hypothetical protein n=1 Tax=Actinophytocola sp. TaxID=1872138 RepID=UPI002DBBEFAB|nr:hypothetical protein [Actinophytocola sp.]HEU5473405.1 hypothetical protein [Actinophytocola sp.]